jgi:phosphotransferase system  glucose/maltose/N-acetylglucosamine-specific IIC component
MSNGSGSSSNATLILVLGILSLVCCGLLGPVAWIMGNNALRDIDAGLGNPNDRGLVVAGRILGIIATVLLVLGILIYGAIFLLAILGVTTTRWSP